MTSYIYVYYALAKSSNCKQFFKTSIYGKLRIIFNQPASKLNFHMDISINYCSISSSLAIEFNFDVYDLMLSYILHNM